MEKENISKYNVMQPLVLSACVAIGMMVGFKMNDKPDNTLISMSAFPKDSTLSVGRVEELLRFIDSKYVEEIKSNELIDEAVNAIFSKLDPHSVYLSPHEVQDIDDQMDGGYNGIGVENFFIDDTVNISSILIDGPAQKGGLKVFDKITEIDGESVAGKSLDYKDIRSRLRKEAGKQVQIKVIRDKKKLTFNLKVDEVPIKTVSSILLPEISTALIRIDRFGSNTYKEFMEEVEKHFGSKKAKHIIIDLRDNPGGFLPEATNILCQIFEEKERLLLYTEGRNSKKNQYKSNGKRFFPIEKVVVLIDENSASASEIIAGAIQDWDRGIIVGRRSYGKGLVQEQYPLNNGGAVRLTVASYYTPSGRSIQRDYSDSVNYNDDLADRYQNGDLFHKDSSIVKNGGKYYTQLLKRSVSGSGGISPDVFIPLPKYYKDEKAFDVKVLLPEFVFRYLAANKHLFPKKEPEFKNAKIPLDLYVAFKSFLLRQKDAFPNESALPTLSDFEYDIRQQIKNILYREVNKNLLVAEGDEFIAEAIRVISTNKNSGDYK